VQTMTFWQTSKFRQLEKEWYEKLKENGFIDAEKTTGKQQVLIQFASNALRQASQLTRESKAEYFSLLFKCVNADAPTDRIELLVMSRRAEGAKIEEISKELKQLGGKFHRQMIRYIIRRYEHKWNIRIWPAEKLCPPWRRAKKAPTK
jgi:hypothetical protein